MDTCIEDHVVFGDTRSNELSSTEASREAPGEALMSISNQAIITCPEATNAFTAEPAVTACGDGGTRSDNGSIRNATGERSSTGISISTAGHTVRGLIPSEVTTSICTKVSANSPQPPVRPLLSRIARRGRGAVG